MHAGTAHSTYFFGLLVLCLITLAVSEVRGDVNLKQARKAITRMPGFELTNGAVKVTSVSTTGNNAEATALVRGVFRFEQDTQAQWRVAEIRTGPNTWEDIGLIAGALGTTVPLNNCNPATPPARFAGIEPSVKRARCLLGSLFGVEVPSDAIRIQEVAPFAIPLASQPSTTVIAWIRLQARLVNQGKTGWQVSELRVGNREWVQVEPVLSRLNEAKRETARSELTTIAQALEKFRSERGGYLVSDKHSVVIDHLSPRYLSRVIRVDPWHQPYSYQGQKDTFTLSSAGPDGKEATPDDIIVTGPSH